MHIESSQQINTIDLFFLKRSVLHPKLGIKTSIQLLDILVKQYLNELYLSNMAFGPLQILMSKYSEN